MLLLVDDLQWIDQESQTALLFAARRVRHDAIAMLFACRESPTGPELFGIDESPARRTEHRRRVGPTLRPSDQSSRC